MSQEEPSKDSTARTSPASAAGKPATSERRTEANRINALRSTGPKTELGKRTVARNAIKHGILAREVVIKAGDGEESLEEFLELVKQLFELYEPDGVVEESLIQTIATSWWRRRRVLRCETGAIRRQLDTLANRHPDAHNSDAQRFSLGGFGEAELLLRYEAHIDRQLDRAMDRLERLQRQRRGENAPPPLNI
jgi:hypothetical protein